MLTVNETAISAVKVLTPKRFGDGRGFFSETYNKQRFSEAGVTVDFVQDNHSHSARTSTIRGLHFQSAPFAQDKLVRVSRGRIFDVAVDLRRSSPTFGRHVAMELSAENGAQAFIPIGFAHGFCTLDPDTEVIYKVSSYYSPIHYHGLAWDDPALGIQWPVAPREAVLSEKDHQHPVLADLPSYFD
jgi:dTDP-4-dehydrorhamnose 3,5-epimerase